MLSRDVRKILGSKDTEIITEQFSSVLRVNDIVNETTLGANQRIRKSLRVLDRMLLRVLAAVNDLDSTLGSHDGDFCSSPCVIDISTQVLAGHDIVSTTVRLACNYSHLWDIRLSIRKKQLGTIADDAAMFLIRTR